MNNPRWASRGSGPALRATLAALVIAFVGCSSGDGTAEESVEGGMDEQGEDHRGEHVEEGTGGRVTLGEAALRNAGIEVGEVQSELGNAATDGLDVPGRVAFSPDRIALISPRTSGRIERLTVVEGNRVRAGQPVAYILSPAFLTAQNDFIQAARRADVLAGTADEEGAQALVTAAQRRLQLLGAPTSIIDRLQSDGEFRDLLPVVAPFAGSIVEAHVLAGAAVEPGTPIFTIANLSVVDVVADVPEQALRYLTVGQAATVRLSAYPERVFSGRVERLHDELNPETRTVEAVILVPNPRRTLRPGMFASVTLRVPVADGASTASATLTIPASSVVTDGATRYVFIELAPGSFERRAVELTPMGDGSRFRVLSGLSAGDRIVVHGAFTLKSELGKAAFGDEH